MPFPILITTSLRMEGSHPYGQAQVVSGSVNTLVHEFDTRELAEDAIDSINAGGGGDGPLRRWATRMYKRI
jgi:hypothetical protein